MKIIIEIEVETLKTSMRIEGKEQQNWSIKQAEILLTDKPVGRTSVDLDVLQGDLLWKIRTEERKHSS